MTKQKDWFATWFDSAYYHLLYQHRSQSEADEFVCNFNQHFNPIQGDVRWLDLACGKGRFSIALSKLDADIVGLDLSKNSIDHNKTLGLPRAQFEEHDMRLPIPLAPYDIIFNMFTSFGYFEQVEENTEVIRQIRRGLKTKGIFVMDYMHCERVVEQLIPEERILRDGVRFDIRRELSGGMIRKAIEVRDETKAIHFSIEETVRYYTVSELREMAESVGFKLLHQWGNYACEPFDPSSSMRHIMVMQKV